MGLAGPFLLSWLLNLGVDHWLKPSAAPLSAVNQLGGLAVGIVWGGLLVTMAVAVLALLPLEKFELESCARDVRQSKVLAVIRPVLAGKGLLPAAKIRAPCLNDVCKMDDDDKKTLSFDQEMQEFTRDPHIQKLLHDPEAMAAIRSQNFTRIMNNPVINELKADPAFLLKAMHLYPKIQQKINAHETAD